MTTWNIGLDSWIIQDGNYPDFEVGEERRFALEFSPKTLSLSTSKDRRVEYVSGARYKFVGEVLFIDDEVWVIDFGLPAYSESPPPAFVHEGGTVEGELYLGVDPFTYKESLFSRDRTPHLFRHFLIRAVFLETTPRIPGYAGAVATLKRDESKESFVPVPKTDAWHDDDKNAHDVLECTVVPDKQPNTPQLQQLQ